MSVHTLISREHMQSRHLKVACALAALLLPAVALAQSNEPGAARGRSFELSVGGGYVFLDQSLRDFLGSGAPEYRFADSPTPSGGTPQLMMRLGYNFTPQVGFSVAGTGGKGSGMNYMTSSGAMTFTTNLNAKTSPFLLLGTELTRIEGQQERVTHSTWGAHAGVGIRRMIRNDYALRIEAKLPLAHFQEVPMAKATVFNPAIMVGISRFMFARRMAQPEACVACSQRVVVRVDTIREYYSFPRPTPAVLVVRDTLVLEGVNFAFDEAILVAGSQDVLDRVARELQEPQWRDVRFEVAGHTSSVATAEYNMALSQRRAEAVRAYLVSRGVADDRMVARGYGETQPIFPNSREGDAWQNRRVELRRLR